jgi:hypothetical protein
VNKSNPALNALKIIRKYFNTKELLQLVTSNFYSVLCYSNEVWQLNNLKQRDKSLLLTSSSNALKMATHCCVPYISFQQLYVTKNRATREMYSNYTLSLDLNKTFNTCVPMTEWSHLNFNQTLMPRQTKFHVNKTINLRVGMNAL